MKPMRPLWISLIMLPLVACGYQGMFFTEHTHVGAQIKISPETDNKPVDVNIGYDRGLLAVVPRTELGQDAGSVISKTDLDIVFTTNSTIKNIFATGAAAKNITREGERVAALFGHCLEDIPDLQTRKKTARSKLNGIKDDKDQLKVLYLSVFPTRTDLVTTTKDEMYHELLVRLTAICYSKQDDDTLKKYEAIKTSKAAAPAGG